MKLIILLLVAFTTLLFGMGMFIGGTIAMRPYIEQAKVSKAETNTFLAMDIEQLTNVRVF